MLSTLPISIYAQKNNKPNCNEAAAIKKLAEQEVEWGNFFYGGPARYIPQPYYLEVSKDKRKVTVHSAMTGLETTYTTGTSDNDCVITIKTKSDKEPVHIKIKN